MPMQSLYSSNTKEATYQIRCLPPEWACSLTQSMFSSTLTTLICHTIQLWTPRTTIDNIRCTIINFSNNIMEWTRTAELTTRVKVARWIRALIAELTRLGSQLCPLRGRLRADDNKRRRTEALTWQAMRPHIERHSPVHQSNNSFFIFLINCHL